MTGTAILGIRDTRDKRSCQRGPVECGCSIMPNHEYVIGAWLIPSWIDHVDIYQAKGVSR